ncbi:MAG: calcium-binding protein [Hyphomicrobiaceae bacterium]
MVLKTADILDAATGATLIGSESDDTMSGGAGDDHLRGKNGDDTIHGDGVGTVTVPLDIAGSVTGADLPVELSYRISGLPQGATLSAGADNGDGSWTVVGDAIVGLQVTAPDTGGFTLRIFAAALDDSSLTAEADLNVTLAGGNADLIEGGKGNDTLFGDAGDDIIYGGSKPSGAPANPDAPLPPGNDELHGGDGNDTIYAGHDDDHAWGDAGDDWISGGKGDDHIDGGDGNDVLYGNTGDDVVIGGAGNDIVEGGKGNDVLSDGDGGDTVAGGSGDDTILMGEGDDSIRGGAGFDTLDFSAAKGSITAHLSDNVATGMGNDTFNSIEAVIGSDFNDVVIGSTKDNVLKGGAGDDVLTGGRGYDTLTGGEGSDTFVFRKVDLADGSHDVITDFGVGDRIDVSDILKGQKFSSIEDVISVKSDGDNAVVYAHLGDDVVQVAVIEGFAGHSASDLLKDGMLLT